MCAIDGEGKAHCFGNNWSGALGTGSIDHSDIFVPVNASEALSGIFLEKIVCGSHFSLALSNNGRVFKWCVGFYVLEFELVQCS